MILTDIYSAGETNTANISVDCIYEEVLACGHPQALVLKKRKIVDYLLNRPNPHGVVAFIGAGDIGELADELANRFKNLTAA